jgi:pimeloyl-ACP methyl ester carboxylesterase
MHASRTEPRKRTELTLDTSISVPGGRSLTYTDLGASSGPVVIYLHGAPSSRLDLVLFEDALAALGVRVVSADRPGYGGSSPIVGRRLEDWRRKSPPWPIISASNGLPSWEPPQVDPTPSPVRPSCQTESPAPAWYVA